MAAYEEAVRSVTLTAGGVLAQFVAVEIEAATGDAITCGADSPDVVGITQEDVADGSPVQVALPGCKTKWTAGAAIAAGARVTTDAAGKCVTAVATDSLWGYCLNAPGADGEIATVLFTGFQGAEA